mmetsp:Transcript_51097/g.132687  ORF Transcript_51097/g.132687 Transcript_51097/m.132687 type:complete len:233 (+) Transcript_51097:26-724(+)
MAAATASPSPVSPWSYSATQPLFARTGTAFSGQQHVAPYGSFLAPLNSYRVEGEDDDLVRHQPALSSASGFSPLPSPALADQTASLHHVPNAERLQSWDVAEYSESTFADMDASFSRVSPHALPRIYPHHLPGPPRNVPLYRLSGEEQAWLDQEFDAEMEMVDDACGDEASRTGSLDERFDDFDGEETEEEFVRGLLSAHPALDEAEARWLWHERERCFIGRDIEPHGRSQA